MEYKGYRFDNLYKEAERDIIDELKEETEYLKKKIKHYKYREEDLEDEINELSQKKGQLENDIETVVKESIKLKRNLEEQSIKGEEIVSKNKEFELEMNDMIGELKDARNVIKQKEEEEKKFETKKQISDDVIRQLKEENVRLNKQVEVGLTALEKDLKHVEYDTLLNDVEQMGKEIKYLKEVDEEKTQMINHLNEESLKAKDNELQIIENKILEYTQKEKSTSLYEEMSVASKDFKCDICEKPFYNKSKRKHHVQKYHQKFLLEKKEQEVRTKISNRRIDLIKRIYCLRETEIVDKFSCNSTCSPGCRIFHEKHNWSRSRSQELLERLNNIQNIGCNLCDQSFSRKSDVEKHIKTCHIVDRGVDSVEKVTELEKHGSSHNYFGP